MASNAPSRIFQRTVSSTNLRHLYYLHVLGGTARGRDGIAPDSLVQDLADTSDMLAARLRAGTYRFTPYKELLVSKGANKAPRVLSVPAARDRITLRALANFLGEVYPIAKGVIPQVRVAQVHEAVAKQHFDSYIRIDLCNFYPSIDHQKIEAALSQRIKKREILDVLMKAVRTPTLPERASVKGANGLGVPQGLAISNLLSELVVGPVDGMFTQRSDCAYFRFVDDILVLCNQIDKLRLIDELDVSIRNCGLQMHPMGSNDSKSRHNLVSKGFEYLGYHFSDSRVSVRKPSVNKVESSLARIFTRYKRSDLHEEQEALRICMRRVNLLVTGCIYEDNPYGWLHYFRQMNDEKLLKELDSTVKRFCRRFSMPEDFHPKTFMRAYWAIRHPNGKDRLYIPRFDNLDEDGMRGVLSDFIGSTKAYELPSSAVPRAFCRIMKQITSELERDIVSVS